jgi:hypothetical protein
MSNKGVVGVEDLYGSASRGLLSRPDPRIETPLDDEGTTGAPARGVSNTRGRVADASPKSERPLNPNDRLDGSVFIDSVFISNLTHGDIIQAPRMMHPDETSIITIDKQARTIHITRGRIKGHLIHDKMVTSEKNHSSVHRESFSL